MMKQTMQSVFGNPVEILYEFDELKIWVTKTNEFLFFIYACGEDLSKQLNYFIVIPVIDIEIKMLKQHQFDVNTLFQKDLIFFVTADFNDVIHNYQSCKPADIIDYIPKPGIYLYY